MSGPAVDLTFTHNWKAEILATRPLILPPRHFVYPQQVEEVERGALEVLVRPGPSGAPESILKLPKDLDSETWDSTPFLATCALGFRDPAVPTGIWSAPNPHQLCAVSGGYAYLIDTRSPERFTFIAYRPALQIIPVLAQELLLFVGHRSILAWGREGQAWESGKLSDEGVTVVAVDDSGLHGLGWNMITDKEAPFTLDLKSGSLK